MRLLSTNSCLLILTSAHVCTLVYTVLHRYYIHDFHFNIIFFHEFVFNYFNGSILLYLCIETGWSHYISRCIVLIFLMYLLFALLLYTHLSFPTCSSILSVSLSSSLNCMSDNLDILSIFNGYPNTLTCLL